MTTIPTSTKPLYPLLSPDALSARLRTLEGQEFTTLTEAPCPPLGHSLPVVVTTAALSEGLLTAVVGELVAGATGTTPTLQREPLGANTFPDLEAITPLGKQAFECKSWVEREPRYKRWAGRGWAAARESCFYSALLAEDPKYFTTLYCDFHWKLQGSHRYLLKAATVGHLWDFSTGSRYMSSQRAFASDGSTTPSAFLKEAFLHRGYEVGITEEELLTKAQTVFQKAGLPPTSFTWQDLKKALGRR